MAFILLRLLVLGVIAAAADDEQITWLSHPRGVVPCVVPEAGRAHRRPPPPINADDLPLDADDRSLDADDLPLLKPNHRRGDDDATKRLGADASAEVVRKRNGTEGVYQCVVEHHAGRVLGLPAHWKFASMEKQFSKQPENDTASAGQPYVLSCDIPSSPTATVSWLRNDEILPRNDRYIFLDTQLLFTEIRKEDSGIYKCIATNTYLHKTRTSQGGWLKVKDPVDAEPAMLPITDAVNVTAPSFSRVQLLCPVLGWPRPRITWELTQPGSRTVILESTEEVFDIQELNQDLEGVYKCSIDDYRHLSKIFDVRVSEPVIITLPPVSKEAIRASTVRFNCTATGRPAPNITWYKDGELLQLGGRFNLRASTSGKRYELVVGGVTSGDAGIYQCFASNGLSTTSSWAALTVTGASADAPSAFRCWPLTARTVLLRWDRPSGNVMAYNVLSVPALYGQPHQRTEETITVSEPLTTYRFQVRAYFRGKGMNIASDMSEPVFCQSQGVPVRISKKSEDTVLVSWKEFALETPGVVQWILQYKPENTTDEHNVTLPGETQSYLLNVSPDKPMQVRVLGSKTEEWLPQNLTYLTWTSTNAPDDAGDMTVIPEDLRVMHVWSHEFTVGWRCEGAETYAFMVCVRKPDGPSKCLESYNNSATIGELEPDTEYEVEVHARRPGRPAGPPSTPLFVTTLADGPERFKEMSLKFVNASTVRISWNAPPGKFRVLHSTELNVAIDLWDAVDAMGNTALIPVDPTKDTYVMVTGFDPIVYSPVKTILAQVPIHPAPGKERFKNLTWHFLNASTLRVSWNAPPAKYKVLYSTKLNEPIEQWDSVDTVDNIAWISNVDPKKDLYLMVSSRDPLFYSSIKTIPAQTPDVQWWWTSNGVGVRWASGGRLLRYSQNVSSSPDHWPALNVSGTSVELTGLDPNLRTYVMVSPSTGQQNHVFEQKVFKIPARPAESSSLYLGIGIGGAIFFVLVLAVAMFCVWRRRKRAGSPLRTRRRRTSLAEEDEGAEMKNVGGRLANGGGTKDAGEPLLNGHVHITENPQSKAPNGKMKKGVIPFDLSRYEDPDSTLETVLDESAAYELLDTSRPHEPDIYPKLPDDNMNSELNRSAHFQLDNSKIQPTLQPNG